MAKNGFRIFDTDTHVGPDANILERYMSAAEKKLLEPLERYRLVDDRSGHVEYTYGRRKYQRKLGEAEPIKVKASDPKNLAVRKFSEDLPLPQSEVDPAERIKDMDREGVDVNLTLPSSWFGTFTEYNDIALEAAMYRAYHRWMAEYCGSYPNRIKGVILVCFRDIEGSLKEIERWARTDWPLAAFIYAPSTAPLDHPALEPIWSACEYHDLPIALHTFTAMPPYAPGGLDTWDNYFIQRATAHSWCGERNTASFIGSGIMDRYPKLRVAPLEAGHGWLPFWMTRLDEHAKSHAKYMPELKMKPSEYVLSGRYFQSIEMSEGEKLTKAVIDLIGEDILMYASDYPHRESWFPKAVDTVMSWNLPDRVKQKLFWDNPIKYYARYNGN